MAAVEFEGKDLEEAIAKAAEALSLPPEKLKFTLITMGGKGFLGFGRRKARISVDPADPSLALEEAEQAAETAAEAAPKKPEPRREAPSPLKGEAPPPREKPGKESRRAEAEKAPEPSPIDFSHVPPPLTRPGPGESAGPADEQARAAEEILKNILNKMGFEAALSSGRIGPRVILTIDSPDKALIIGSRGSTLEALQLMTGKIMAKNLKDSGAEIEEGFRVLVDMADYRQRRQETILETLKKAAEDARRLKKPQQVGGLNSAERRLAQLALRPFKDLSVNGLSGREGLTIAPAGHSASGPRPGPGGKAQSRRGGPRRPARKGSRPASAPDKDGSSQS